MILKDNETLCGFFGIPTVVMPSSHSSLIYLNLDIGKVNHVTLASPTHHNTPHTNAEDLDDER